MSSLRCVLITPARNEEAFIAKTIESMVNQTIRPIRWVIVNDGSTDRTAAIVCRYAASTTGSKWWTCPSTEIGALPPRFTPLMPATRK